MNDITALAQRMKAAAKQSAFSSRHSVGMEVAVDSLDFIELTTPANVLALVEALEKAQRYIDRLREWNANLAYESCEYQKRIAELGSRTVTVKLPAACEDDEYFNDGVFQPMRYERDVERALRAAGIQVIEGEG